MNRSLIDDLDEAIANVEAAKANAFASYRRNLWMAWALGLVTGGAVVLAVMT